MNATDTRSIDRAALAVGDFLFLDDGLAAGVFGLVVARQGAIHAHVLLNTGRVDKSITLKKTVHVAVGVPVEDFGANLLVRYAFEQEAEAQAARDRAERLRLAVELVRQTQANQPGVAAEFARVIGQR